MEDAAPFPLAHDPLPGDHGAVVHLAELLGAGDPETAQEVRDVATVGTAGPGALLLGQPHHLLRDRGQGVEGGELAGREGGGG